MATITEVLHRRSDLSTFVVHLTRRSGDEDPVVNLLAMLRGTIQARTPMGWGKDAAIAAGPRAAASQRVVCFSETPLEQIYSLSAEIQGRRIRLEPYGLAFTKMVARRKGANPILYVDMTGGHDWAVAHALDGLRKQVSEYAATYGEEWFGSHPAASLLPFCEGMGTWATSQKEFWWEREWRKLGDFHFVEQEVALIIAPEEAHAAMRRGFSRPLIDASWSLERMIASLAHLSPADVTPFSARKTAHRKRRRDAEPVRHTEHVPRIRTLDSHAWGTTIPSRGAGTASTEQ